MDGASEPSYVHGASPVALLGETIGQNLDRTAARCRTTTPWSLCTRRAHDLRRSSTRPSRRCPRGCWPSGSSPASGSASGRPTTPSG